MEPWIIGTAGAILGLVLLAYAAVPLLLLRMMRLDLDARIDEVAVDAFPSAVRDYFTERGADLEALGFVDVGLFRLDTMVPRMESGFRMMIQPAARTVAMATWMQPTILVQGSRLPPILYTEFSSETADGIEIDTNNSNTCPSADRDPRKITHHFADIADVSLLWELHQLAVRESVGPRGLRPIPLDLPPAAMLRREFHRQMAPKVTRGYWKPADAPGRFRLTLKGAYLSTWAEMPPFKQWRQRTTVRRARALRERLAG